MCAVGKAGMGPAAAWGQLTVSNGMHMRSLDLSVKEYGLLTGKRGEII